MKNDTTLFPKPTIKHSPEGPIMSIDCELAIENCVTRNEVAETARLYGFDAYVGGHHVSIESGGIRRAIVTSDTLPDFN